jgi:hypothetical protein
MNFAFPFSHPLFAPLSKALWVLAILVSTLPVDTFAAALPRPTVSAQIQSTYTFPLDLDGLKNGDVQYHSELIIAPRSPLASKGFQVALGMDYPRYWGNRGDDRYSVMLGRAAFTIDKPVEFYTRERALSVDRLNRLMPEFPLKKLGTEIGLFKSESAPSCKIKIETFSKADVLKLEATRPELHFPERLHPELGTPDFLVLQNNFDFDRIFGFRTSQGAITLSAHYRYSPEQTLVLVYSLGFLHNLPPDLWGGAQLVMDTSRDATLVLVERLRKE